MPKCPQCGTKNKKAYKFCSNCGAQSEEVTGAGSKHHIAVMGGAAVGKSALTIRFVMKKFVTEYDPTIEDRYEKSLEYKEIPLMLEILDTAGTEYFSAIRELYMKNGEGFVLVYDITNKKTLEDVDKIRKDIVRIKTTDNVPMVLVGNKVDLEKNRKVETQEAKDIAKTYGCQQIEASAKTGKNVDEVFTTVIDAIWAKNGGPPKKEKEKDGKCVIV